MDDKLVRLSDVTAAMNSEGYTKNMRVHKKVLSIPAVDAVEVVRCRECRNYKPSEYNASTALYCGVIDGFPEEDWFCADGQRREDGANGKHL